jgi:type I restriction enzyme S subunit
MKKYDNYKDSGIHWLGDIPKHWEVKKLKFFASVVLGKMLTSEDKGGYILKPYLRAKNIEWITPNIEDVKEMWFSKNEISQYRIEKSDLLVSEGGEVGRTCIWNNELEECYIQNSVHKVRILNEGTPYYFLYQFLLLGRLGHFDAIVNRISIAHLTKEKLEDVVFISPHISEQTIIAKYLNHKTTQIDNLIQKKERLIELLQEERIALINQAVTKGLDPNAPMKDSGIEWLGEIPAHWSEARVKNIVNIIGRIGFRGYTTADLVEKGEGAISLSPSNIKNHVLNIDDCTYLSWEKYNESPEIKIYRNDIILVKTGSTIGKTAIIPADTPEMTLNPQLVVFKEIKLEPLFLYYVMISDYFQGYFNVYTAGGSTPAISQEKINNFKITYPDIEEQKEISEYICKKEFEIKQIINSAKQEIELLKEYKTALISEVVTGKVDVRGEILN